MNGGQTKGSKAPHNLANVRIARDLASWEIEISAEIPVEILQRYRAHALKELQMTARLDGFRPGKAPVERIVDVYGESAIMKQALEKAIQYELPQLLASENALIIESPRVSIEPPEKNTRARFTARAALAPIVELPDYKAIARTTTEKKEKISVSDEEHAQAMVHLRRERARIGKIEAGIEPKKAHEESRAMKEEELPELDDAFVRSLGIENAEKFSETVRANIKTEKELQAREQLRTAVLDKLIGASTIHYPSALREYELNDIEARMKHDLERIGTDLDLHLRQIQKTRAQLRTEWYGTAEKRAKVRLILTEIARRERIEPDKTRLEQEVAHARKHASHADPEVLRAHIAHALRNEATLMFLEDLKE